MTDMQPTDAPDRQEAKAAYSTGRKMLRFATLAAIASVVVANYWEGVKLDLGGWLLAVLSIQPLIALSITLHGIRHALLLPLPIRRRSLGICIKAIAVSTGLNMIIPARIGELLAATYIRDKLDMPFSTGLSAVFLARTIDVLMLALISVASILLSINGQISHAAVGAALFLILAIILVSSTRFPDLVHALLRRLSQHKLAAFADRFFTSLARQARWAQLWPAASLTILMWSLAWLSIFLFLRQTLGPGFGPSQALVVLVTSTLGAAIPGLPAAVGTYEAGAIAGLMLVGVDLSQALPLSILLHFSQIILSLMIGLVFASTESTGLSRLLADSRTLLRKD